MDASIFRAKNSYLLVSVFSSSKYASRLFQKAQIGQKLKKTKFRKMEEMIANSHLKIPLSYSI
ncbi:hypothetical protein BES34_006060 [Leptospira inadai serovar Lyme]|uniref:Uncharacterized protein n=1 Tax=Leptospira inadai serovar Lyme TaxID=293084 RepID=A0ABX4YLB3_9LEPT|nr:hypothetical protein BES34_006060 [Leptospira inadai serovar Lyme]